MTRTARLAIASLLLMLSGPMAGTVAAQEAPAAKRVAAPTVPPVVIGGFRIEAIQYGKSRGLPQNGGYIVATDRKSGRESWILKVYDVPYKAGLESDVQDIFIKSMRRSGQRLRIVDENGRSYLVDVKRRSVEAE